MRKGCVFCVQSSAQVAKNYKISSKNKILMPSYWLVLDVLISTITIGKMFLRKDAHVLLGFLIIAGKMINALAAIILV